MMKQQTQQQMPQIQHQLTGLAMNLFEGTRGALRRMRSGGRAALLEQHSKAEAVVQPVLTQPPKPNHDVTEEVNPQKSGVAYYHPHSQLDGVEHINIDSRGKTELGRLLVHMEKSDFTHQVWGPFSSMEGFWGFVRNGGKGDQFRKVHGMAARRESKAMQTQRITDFEAIILEANYFRAMANPRLHQLLIESTLPFEHYYIFGEKGTPAGSASNPGKLVHPPASALIVRIMTDLRIMLKAGKTPPRPDYSDMLPKDEGAVEQKQ